MIFSAYVKRKREIIKKIDKYPLWWQEAVRRDKFRCVDCRIGRGQLVVHHIDESRKLGLKNMNNSLDNLVTLCRPCHARRHGYTNAREDIIEMRRARMTYAEIGKVLGVSKQRVQQIYSSRVDRLLNKQPQQSA